MLEKGLQVKWKETGQKKLLSLSVPENMSDSTRRVHICLRN